MSVDEQTCLGNPQDFSTDYGASEQSSQQIERLGGDEFTANALARQSSPLQQKHASGGVGSRDCGRASGGSSTDHDEVVLRSFDGGGRGHGFHAITPMRNK